MKLLICMTKRYVLTALSKMIAFFAAKIHANWIMVLLDKALKSRDVVLCKEAKYCMAKVLKWQKKAQNCIYAHTKYEDEVKQKEEKK